MEEKAAPASQLTKPMKLPIFKTLSLVAMALIAGTTFAATAKRLELGDRLDALADADSTSRGDQAKLAQWLNQDRWDNWQNWLNY
jgi:hypothetical protein